MIFTARAARDFPSFSEGLSLRLGVVALRDGVGGHFPSFSEGLSLRLFFCSTASAGACVFPFLFGGAFIEATATVDLNICRAPEFPFLFGGAFIEATLPRSII